MSIVVSGIKMPYEASEEYVFRAAYDLCSLKSCDIRQANIYKISLDLRKNQLNRVWSVILDTFVDENALVARINSPYVKIKASVLTPIVSGVSKMTDRPIIVGFGPAGIFAALVLAKNGYAPIVFECGGNIEERDKKTEIFFKSGILDTFTNVQFGEGGAGTYSDGKLTTRTNDPRGELVLSELIRHGAPKEISIVAKPHIGTDILKKVVQSIREEIISLGGEVHFNCPVTEIKIVDGKLQSIMANGVKYYSQTVILATGHSARDMFKELYKSGVPIVPKSFAIGVRIEHKQETIDRGLYGKFYGKYDLPAGEYALSHTELERGCYTFCMCPGGEVVACSSEDSGVVTNGMSYHSRAGENANSAVVVAIKTEDFPSDNPFYGMEFQINIEKKAFQVAGESYAAPVQLFGDFNNDTKTRKLGSITPTYSRGYTFCELNAILPGMVTAKLKKTITYFGQKINGFDANDAVLTAPETRTSSPLRILRNEQFESDIQGVFPAGEGAGYAGGIMSAAQDGIKVASEIMSRYKPKE